MQEIKKGIHRKQKNTILAVAGIILLLAAAFFSDILRSSEQLPAVGSVRYNSDGTLYCHGW